MMGILASPAFIAVAIIMTALSPVNGDVNTQCSLCFANTLFTKYCPMYWDSSDTGLCCLSSATTGACTKSYYYCSSSVTNSRASMLQYAFCSYSPSKCGAD